MKRALFWLIAIGISASGGGAVADTTNYSCGGESCTYEHRIGESMTRTFQGQCYSHQPISQNCIAKNENVTCTITVCSGDSCSCQCTNWSPTGRHPAAIAIYC